MKASLLWVFAVLALGLTLGPGWYHGLRTFRWGQDLEVRGLVQQLRDFPLEFDGWQSTAELQLQPVEVDQLQPAGYLARRYTLGNYQASVFVLIGPTGPTAVHTPDICFNSRDYRSLGERKPVDVGQSAVDRSQCWMTRFQSTHVDQHCMKSWYAWTTDGTWSASAQPRYEFADSRYLVKLQISVFYPDRESMERDEVGEKFVKSVSDRLTEVVFADFNK